MEIHFVDRGQLLTDADRQAATRSFLFALSRFGEQIQRVTVLTEDVNGPRGGIDKRCVARAILRRQGTVEVTQQAAEFGEGFARIARRLGHSVARKLKFQSEYSRDSIRTFHQA